MTFEEFFAKKRIDLTMLRQAKPDLYDEFRTHYTEMGEKSFDHTKKYWFNRLRKNFLLDIIEVPKAKASTKSAETPVNVSTSAAPRPTGFKPRFNPNAAKAKKDSAGPTANDKAIPSTTTKPSGFKPRFKPGVTTKSTTPADASTPADAAEPDKQPVQPASDGRPLGFKPRFKAGIIPPKSIQKKDENSEQEEQSSLESPSPTAPTEEHSAAPVSKPLGFKPRFKAGKTTNKKDGDAPS